MSFPGICNEVAILAPAFRNSLRASWAGGASLLLTHHVQDALLTPIFILFSTEPSNHTVSLDELVN